MTTDPFETDNVYIYAFTEYIMEMVSDERIQVSLESTRHQSLF